MSEEQTDEHVEEENLFDFGEVLDEALQEDFETPASAIDPTEGVSSQSELELMDRVNDAEGRVVRAQADLENFRRRMRREMDDQRKFANQGLITDLLPVIDNVYRAISAASKEEASNGILEGFLMVAQQLIGTLNKFDCERIDAVGEVFDPNKHEAISQMPSDEVEKGIVLQAVQEGYILHDRVIRPSQVIISTGPAEAEA